MTAPSLGHVLDMLSECNDLGGMVTISGMGVSQAWVTVTAGDGRRSFAAAGPTLTLALESLRRKVRKAARA